MSCELDRHEQKNSFKKCRHMRSSENICVHMTRLAQEFTSKFVPMNV